MTRRFTSLAEGLALFADDPLAFEPGTKVLYSTYGYTLLGCAAARAAGQPFLTLLQETVFAPAGMTATRADDVRELIPNRAQGYVRDGSGQLLNSALADMSYKVPGGGLCGTAPDVARFGAALLSGRLVTRETLQRMLTRQKTRDGRATGYGLGLAVGTRGGQREAWHHGRAGARQHRALPPTGRRAWPWPCSRTSRRSSRSSSTWPGASRTW